MSVCLTGYTHPKFYNPKIKFVFNMKAAFQCHACDTSPETILFILRLLSVVLRVKCKQRRLLLFTHYFITVQN